MEKEDVGHLSEEKNHNDRNGLNVPLLRVRSQLRICFSGRFDPSVARSVLFNVGTCTHEHNQFKISYDSYVKKNLAWNDPA
jgi:hypothetical protein